MYPAMVIPEHHEVRFKSYYLTGAYFAPGNSGGEAPACFEWLSCGLPPFRAGRAARIAQRRSCTQAAITGRALQAPSCRMPVS